MSANPVVGATLIVNNRQTKLPLFLGRLRGDVFAGNRQTILDPSRRDFIVVFNRRQVR